MATPHIQPHITGAPCDLLPGQVLNQKYTIIHHLGQGGMGALYLANRSIAGQAQPVVVKELLAYYDPKDANEAARALKRFEAEASILAILNTPGVPQVFDYFYEGGHYFIVMQYIEGQNLDQGLTHFDEVLHPVPGKSYPVEQVRRWGVQLCHVLESLAAHQVLHLDIKPANLIQDQAGNVWLVDFGASKALQPIGQAGVPGLKKTTIYGTLGYAPPEQSNGKPEARSDVYALAATLYHLVTDDDPSGHPGLFPKLDRISPDFAGALRHALAQDVGARPGASSLARLLEPRSTRPLGFHWQNGAISLDPEELPNMASTHWEEARNYLQSGSWEKWLKDIHRHDLAADLTRLKSQHTHPDLVLDAFLRKLDPSIATARLQLPANLDAGEVVWGEHCQLDMAVINSGAGCLLARLVNPPAGITGNSSDLLVRSQAILKLDLNTSLMNPAAQPQSIPLILDAGPAGQGQVALRINIPEPELSVDRAIVDLGSIYRGQAIICSLTVSNLGRSPCLAQVSAGALWWTANPEHFELPAKKSQEIQLYADTRRMRLGKRSISLNIQATAGGWMRLKIVPIHLTISIFKTVWKSVTRLLAWLGFWIVYGAFAGWFLGSFLAGFIPGILLPWQGALAGALIGILVCLPMAACLGSAGRLSLPRSRQSLRTGLILALLMGIMIGAVTGAFVTWMGLPISAIGIIAGAAAAIGLRVLLSEKTRRLILSPRRLHTI